MEYLKCRKVIFFYTLTPGSPFLLWKLLISTSIASTSVYYKIRAPQKTIGQTEFSANSLAQANLKAKSSIGFS